MLPASMRGLGTIRQDVNISIPQGARVEIKGLQDISLLPSVIENEVKRQQGLVEIIGQMKSRGISGLSASFADVSFVFSSTSCSIISKALSLGGVVLAAKLPKMAGLLGYTFYQGRRFGSEISDYAKIAGGVLGIIHSDEDLAKYGISQQEISKLCSALSIGKDDAFIIIADKRQKAEAAIHAAISRSMLLHVPSETRKADEKGGSSFMRPMAGAHRMYPETDIPPIRITKEILDMALEIKIESVQDRLLRLNSMLGPSLAQAMLRSRNYGFFEKLVSNGISPKLAAITLEQTLVSLKREGVAVDKISPEALESLLKMAEDKLITKAAIPHVLKEMALHPNLSVQKIIESNNLHRLEGSEIEKAWESCGRNMRLFLEKYRLVVDGEDIMQLAKKHGNSK
jgi:glutamyl-tRNA(Gln) amidotransferase subunit E